MRQKGSSVGSVVLLLCPRLRYRCCKLFGKAVPDRVKTNMAHSQAADTNNLGVLEHPIVLRHPAISEQLSVVSRLLCTSKTVGAALCNHAAGQLVMDMKFSSGSSETAELIWLSRNSGLVKSLMLSTGMRCCSSSAEFHQIAHVCSRYSEILHSLELTARPMDFTVEQLAAVVSEHGAKLRTFEISWTDDPDDFMLWERLLADAMQQAATTAAGFNSKPCLGGTQYAQPPGRLPAPAAAPQQQQQPGELIAGQTGVGTAESDSDLPRLPNLQSFGTFYQVSAALLGYLPATLTELSFDNLYDITDKDVTQLKAAFGRLTNLQSLRITVVDLDFVNVSSMVARLPVQSLTSLTMLELYSLQDVSFADMLPAALRRLEVTTTSDAVASPLVIGHLTRLTHLIFDDGNGIMAESALPASLEQLHCSGIAPNVLTGLTNLTKLASCRRLWSEA